MVLNGNAGPEGSEPANLLYPLPGPGDTRGAWHPVVEQVDYALHQLRL